MFSRFSRPPPPLQPLVIRIRCRDGLFRYKLMSNNSISELKGKLSEQVNVPAQQIRISSGPGKPPFSDSLTLAAAHINHGDLLDASYAASSEPVSTDPPPEFTAAQSTTKILLDEDAGSDSSGEEAELGSKCNHGPNVKCPKCTKTQRYVEVHRRCPLHPPWGSCVQCQEWRQSLMPHLKRQGKRKCKKVNLCTVAGQGFSGFAITYGSKYKRLGVVYGKETKEKEIIGLAIYEPPQNSTKNGVTLLDDPKADKVRELTIAMGLKPVAWVFSYAKGRPEILTAQEAILAGQMQLAHGHRFCTLALAVPDPEAEKRFKENPPPPPPKPKALNKQPSPDGKNKDEPPPLPEREGMDAYQVSMQLTRLIRRGIVGPQQDDTHNIHTNEPVIIEMEETGQIPTEFCLVPIPIAATKSTLNVSFPIENRPGQTITQQTVVAYIQDARKRKEPFAKTVSDFHLLLALMDYVEPSIVREMAHQYMERGTVEDGYQLMTLASLGLDV